MESQISEADWNLNNCNSLTNCNRPTTTTNSQNYLIKSKRPTTLVNRRAENQDISERKKVVPRRQNFSESKKKKSNDIVIFGNSITNYSRYQKIFPIKNLLNCQSDINQINYILQNIEHIIYICRQFDLKNILSRLTITHRLPEQLIKDFNILIGNICRRSILILEIMQTSSWMKFAEMVCTSQGIYVYICIYVCQTLLQVVQHPWMKYTWEHLSKWKVITKNWKKGDF